MTATDRDDAGAAALRRLLYVSRSCLGADVAAVAAALANILATARRRNAELAVTGALMLREDRFAQALEGPPAAVQTIFDSIAADPRHTDLTITDDGPAPSRAFPEWSMAYVRDDGGPDIPLTLVDAGREPGPEGAAVLRRLRELAGLPR